MLDLTPEQLFAKKQIERMEKEGGRIGTKDIDKMKELIEKGDLLEAFFSILPELQYDLYRFYYWKFVKRSDLDFRRKWEKLTGDYETLYNIINICHKKKLIKNDTFKKLIDIKNLRNNIAHWLTYDEPKVMISRKQVIDACELGIKLIKDFDKQGTYLALRFMKK